MPTGAASKAGPGTAPSLAAHGGGGLTRLSPATANAATTRLLRKCAKLNAECPPQQDALMRLTNVPAATVVTHHAGLRSAYDEYLNKVVVELLRLGTPERVKYPPSARTLRGLPLVVDHASYPGPRLAVHVAYALGDYEALASSGADRLCRAAVKLAARGIDSRVCWTYKPHTRKYQRLLEDAGWNLMSGAKAHAWLASQAPAAVGIDEVIESQGSQLQLDYERFHRDYYEALGVLAPYGFTSLDQPGLPRELGWSAKLGYRCLTTTRRQGVDLVDGVGRGAELLSRTGGAKSFTWSALNKGNYAERIGRNELGVYYVLWSRTDHIRPVRAWHTSSRTVMRYAKRVFTRSPDTPHLGIPIWWIEAHATELTPADPHRVIGRPRRHEEDTRPNRHRAHARK